MGADVVGGEHDHAHSLLSRISNEMVGAHKEFFGKGPTQAKSYMLDDLLTIVMRGGLTTAEKTMLGFGHPHQVRAFRQLFENAMTERLTGLVEDLTGRKVATYQSRSCSTRTSSSRCSWSRTAARAWPPSRRPAATRRWRPARPPRRPERSRAACA